MANEPNLFGVKEKAKPATRRDPLPAGTMQRLIGRWVALFEAKFHEKPVIRDRDAAALKRMVLHAGEATVSARLALYLDLDDDYVAAEGFPLALLPDRWNKLVAASRKPQDRIQGADRTATYLRSLRKK